MIEIGFDPLRVDTTPMHDLGMVCPEIVGGNGSITRNYITNGIGILPTAETRYYAGNKVYMYIRADAAIAQYDAVELKLDETDAPYACIKTTNASSWCFGIAEVAIPANSYGWLTIEGYVPIANVADASAQGDWLTPSATAGRLDSTAGAHGDSRIRAVTDGNASNQAAVFIHR